MTDRNALAEELTALDVLRKARALIEDEGHWCRGTSAQDKAGRLVDVLSPSAARWCALGALDRAARMPGTAGHRRALLALTNAVGALFPTMGGFTGINSVNDTLGHAAALELYDAAIAALEEEAS